MLSQSSLATFFPYQELSMSEIKDNPDLNTNQEREIVANDSINGSKIIDENKLVEFIDYASKCLKGNERSEAQIFLERLFQAFGHKGIAEAGAVLEDRLRVNDKIKFPDLLWPRKVLIEMKSRGENLQNHFDQAKAYWDDAYEKKTEYVVLCNFDEFWIYNWNEQKDVKDKVPLNKLNEMWRSFPFLCLNEIKPIFGNNLVDVTKKAAEKIAKFYNSLIDRKIEKKVAQRFTLQCLVALFAEDSGLFPKNGFFIDLIDDCINKGQFSYDQFKSLFERMNSKEPELGGRFKGVRYFDGGIFSEVHPIELTKEELRLLYEAAEENWSKVQPSIFGNIFEKSLDERERHRTGSHYTYESDIMRIVSPTILKPWRERIESAKNAKKLYEIWDDLSKFRILDPACGSGNFLYISFRELKALELQLLQKIIEKDPNAKRAKLASKIKGSNFYGIDKNSFAIELAKITLSMAKKFAVDDFNKFTMQNRLFLDETEDPLPFDNLDNNIICNDALFVNWPKVDAIIGNPPFQSKNKMQEEFNDPEYINNIRKQFPDVPGRADYCVYWFRKAHDNLENGGRAGLVGTKTISQTYSRIGGLDYIVSNGGTIIEAIAEMPWSGEAVVHVSIVNWIKGVDIGKEKRRLARQRGERKDGSWEENDLPFIYSSLSPINVTEAKSLIINKDSDICQQGQTHGHKGFLLTPDERKSLIRAEPMAKEVTFPYLTGEDLVGNKKSQPSRFIIDLQPRSSIFEVTIFPKVFSIIEERVLPTMIENAEKEREKYKDLIKKDKSRQNHLNKWWLLWRGREDLISKLKTMDRYIACSRVTKRPIFEFISSEIHPSDVVQTFALNDDYSFGILQSSLHWEWFKARCSTLKGDPRYTSETIFDSFPWPQWGTLVLTQNTTKNPKTSLDLARNIAKAARDLRNLRNKLIENNNYSFRKLYIILDYPGNNPLREAQSKLDTAVLEAYYFGLPKEMREMNFLEFLLKLNGFCSQAEEKGKTIIGPGLPSFCKDHFEFFSDDCVRFKE